MSIPGGSLASLCDACAGEYLRTRTGYFLAGYALRIRRAFEAGFYGKPVPGNWTKRQPDAAIRSAHFEGGQIRRTLDAAFSEEMTP